MVDLMDLMELKVDLWSNVFGNLMLKVFFRVSMMLMFVCDVSFVVYRLFMLVSVVMLIVSWVCLDSILWIVLLVIVVFFGFVLCRL